MPQAATVPENPTDLPGRSIPRVLKRTVSQFQDDKLPTWAQWLAELNPLHQCVELVRAAVLYGFEWNDILRVGVLVVFALLMWRAAIHAMERKLID